MYYRGAAAAIVVFDITSQDSFLRAKDWVKELQRQGSPTLVLALVGNKADLSENRSGERQFFFSFFFFCLMIIIIIIIINNNNK